uniref:Uncharacterized protein n=1 Tax=Branchiostoma floridae TaxID=7739 RepID=C3ZC37_BRAFL|eukprot:XP_002593798.1 hypothetical protein BRAFLDRAFT_75743 [Branchiostoma floridae]
MSRERLGYNDMLEEMVLRALGSEVDEKIGSKFGKVAQVTDSRKHGVSAQEPQGSPCIDHCTTIRGNNANAGGNNANAGGKNNTGHNGGNNGNVPVIPALNAFWTQNVYFVCLNLLHNAFNPNGGAVVNGGGNNGGGNANAGPGANGGGNQNAAGNANGGGNQSGALNPNGPGNHKEGTTTLLFLMTLLQNAMNPNGGAVVNGGGKNGDGNANAGLELTRMLPETLTEEETRMVPSTPKDMANTMVAGTLMQEEQTRMLPERLTRKQTKKCVFLQRFRGEFPFNPLYYIFSIMMIAALTNTPNGGNLNGGGGANSYGGGNNAGNNGGNNGNVTLKIRERCKTVLGAPSIFRRSGSRRATWAGRGNRHLNGTASRLRAPVAPLWLLG